MLQCIQLRPIFVRSIPIKCCSPHAQQCSVIASKHGRHSIYDMILESGLNVVGSNFLEWNVEADT